MTSLKTYLISFLISFVILTNVFLRLFFSCFIYVGMFGCLYCKTTIFWWCHISLYFVEYILKLLSTHLVLEVNIGSGVESSSSWWRCYLCLWGHCWMAARVIIPKDTGKACSSWTSDTLGVIWLEEWVAGVVEGSTCRYLICWPNSGAAMGVGRTQDMLHVLGPRVWGCWVRRPVTHLMLQSLHVEPVIQGPLMPWGGLAGKLWWGRFCLQESYLLTKWWVYNESGTGNSKTFFLKKYLYLAWATCWTVLFSEILLREEIFSSLFMRLQHLRLVVWINVIPCVS